MEHNIAERLNSAYSQMAEIQQHHAIQHPVTLVAVSKTKPTAAIRSAFAAGQTVFGENYVQELVTKALELSDIPQLEWHFIGPIQSNKTRDIARYAAWVHSIDRLKIAERLAAHRSPTAPPLRVLIQVNISDEDSKAGVAPSEVLPLARHIAALPTLQLKGLMTIPAPAHNGDNSAAFAAMQQLSLQLQAEFSDATELSMGMSDDWQQALTFGATMIRLGTAIFGARGSQIHE